MERSPIYLDPRALAPVCKRWRAILMGHHQLWATIVIKASIIDQNNWDRWGLSQLNDRLQRSGIHPLKITIESDDVDDEDDHTISRILDLVMLQSERWNDIKFKFPLKHQFRQKLESVEGRLPLLESLDVNLNLGISDISPSTFDSPTLFAAFSLAPSLKRLVLRPTYGAGMGVLRNMQIPWTQISDVTFDVSCLRSKQDLHEILLRLTVSLTDLMFLDRMQHDPTGWYISKSEGPIVLRKLKQLRFLGSGKGILDVVICPTLEHLDINAGDTPEVVRFLDNSSCSLTHVRLRDVRAQGNDPRDRGPREYSAILQHSSLSTVESLSLAELTDPILDVLVSRCFFPCLESLSLSLDLSGLWENLPYVFTRIEGLQTILESRTCGANLDRHNSSLSLIQPDFIENIARHSLKKYSIFLFLPLCENLGHNYAEIPLQKLRSCCEAWNVRGKVQVLYDTDPFGLHSPSKFPALMSSVRPLLGMLTIYLIL